MLAHVPLALAVLAPGAASASALQASSPPEVDLASRLPALMEAGGIPGVSTPPSSCTGASWASPSRPWSG